MTPEAPDVAETASFLRRFADLMSNGYNATYLHRAADLLDTLTVRVTAASDERNSGATNTNPCPIMPMRWKPNATRSSMTLTAI